MDWHPISGRYRRLSECPVRSGVGHAIRAFSAKIVSEFNQHFGDITCQGLIGMDFSKPGVYQTFLESGIWKDKCEKYVEFMIEKLYELEEDRGLFVQAQ